MFLVRFLEIFTVQEHIIQSWKKEKGIFKIDPEEKKNLPLVSKDWTSDVKSDWQENEIKILDIACYI